MDELFAGWYAALERRHLEQLTFAEVRRALQALSSRYVEQRRSLARRDPLSTPGKRAAYCLFYAPLHFLLIREIVRRLGAEDPPPGRILDLGCGTGAASAAWALETAPRPRITGVDRNRWALGEARRAWAELGLLGSTRHADLSAARPPRGSASVAAFTVNELPAEARAALLERLLAASGRASCLVVEPLARRAAPWWDEWAARFTGAGGRADEWRFPAELPERLRLLDRAAGLDHRELTGRSLYVSATY